MIEGEEGLKELIQEIRCCFKCWDKFQDLDEELRTLIRELYNEGPWFFPPYNNVKGFFGTEGVVFICKIPSTGRGTFPDPNVKMFYDLIDKHGLENAHITDLVKCRKLTRLTDEEWENMLNNCFDFLVKELAILMLRGGELENLKPVLLVPVSNEVYKTLRGRKTRLIEGIANELVKRMGLKDKNELRNVVNEKVKMYRGYIIHYSPKRRPSRSSLEKRLDKDIRDVKKHAKDINVI